MREYLLVRYAVARSSYGITPILKEQGIKQKEFKEKFAMNVFYIF